MKTRLTYWWWIIKYGGKKKIPPELISKKLDKSIETLHENLMQALRYIPSDASEEEKKELLDVIRMANKLERESKKIGK